MLVLQRKAGESIRIGNEIEVVVLSVQGSRIRLGFDCPKEITILRSELDPVAYPVALGRSDQAAPRNGRNRNTSPRQATH